MKRILFFSAALMALAFTGCKRDAQPEEPWGDATYKVSTSDDTRYDLTVGKSKTIGICIQTANGYTDPNNLDVSIKADESKVSKFNAGRDTAAVMLPSDAFQFSNTKTKIYRYNKNSLSIELTVSILPSMDDGHYVLPVDIAGIEGSSVAKADENSVLFIHVVKKHQEVYKGSGTKDDPYLIYDKQDLMDIHDECKKQAGDTTICTYFKMMADVDLGMSRTDTLNWEPINTASPYDKKVDFNGNGKKISNIVSTSFSYASIFGVLYGNVYDLTVENAYIEGGHAIGVIGGYAGTEVDKKPLIAKVYRVKVVDSYVNNVSGSKNGVGGLIGRVSTGCVIDACSFSGKVEAIKQYVGGIAGYDTGTCSISNCSSSGLIICNNQRVGGIMGGIIKASTSIRNCFTTAGVSSTFAAGGIAGHCNLDAGKEQHPYNTISKCIVWCDSLTARSTGLSNYSSGAVAGFCAKDNTCEDCYRRPDLVFYGKDAESTEFFKFVDQPNSNATSPQSVGINCDFSKVYKLPYNGKAAEAGKTPAAIAKELEWDETIWDLSGNAPVLR